jgi:predicted metalloendopeptidase
MDTDSLDRIGAAPLSQFFDLIDSVRDIDSAMAALGQLHLSGVRALFSKYVEAGTQFIET